MEALAAKEREKQQAEERAHAKRLAAMGEAVPDDPAKQVRLPCSECETTSFGVLCKGTCGVCCVDCHH